MKKQGAALGKSSQSSSKKGTGSQGSRGAAPGSPLKATKAQKGDVFELETKELERKIIEQVIQALTFQEVLIASRQYPDIGEFSNQILAKLHLFNKKLERVELMSRYCRAVSGLTDSQQNNLDAQAAGRYQSRGAKIMNAVLSGNLGHTIDIYQSNQQVPGPRSSEAGTLDGMDDTGLGPLSDGGLAPNMLAAAVHDDARHELTPQAPDAAIARENQHSSARTIQSAAGGPGPGNRVLSPTQEGLNYLVNFLSQICDQEDALSSTRILKQCPLFQFG